MGSSSCPGGFTLPPNMSLPGLVLPTAVRLVMSPNVTSFGGWKGFLVEVSLTSVFMIIGVGEIDLGGMGSTRSIVTEKTGSWQARIGLSCLQKPLAYGGCAKDSLASTFASGWSSSLLEASRAPVGSDPHFEREYIPEERHVSFPTEVRSVRNLQCLLVDEPSPSGLHLRQHRTHRLLLSLF